MQSERNIGQVDAKGSCAREREPRRKRATTGLGGELTSRMDYRRILEQPVARWNAAEWTKVATTQQFGIANPRINSPAILAAVARSKNDLASAADIVLTALPAVKTRLHPDLRHRLEEIRSEGGPIEAAA